MALNEFQQFEQLVASSQHILVLFNSKDAGDALSSALALKNILEKQRKQIDIVSADFFVPKNLKFIPDIDSVKPALSHLQKFIIKVDVSKNQIDTISYDVKDNTLSIYLTPKTGLITKHDLRTAQSTFKYDLIITLGVADLESLGEIYYNNTDLFYRAPIVNIDCQANNEHFGHINAPSRYILLRRFNTRRCDGARCNRIHPNLILGQLQCRIFGKPPNSML